MFSFFSVCFLCCPFSKVRLWATQFGLFIPKLCFIRTCFFCLSRFCLCVCVCPSFSKKGTVLKIPFQHSTSSKVPKNGAAKKKGSRTWTPGHWLTDPTLPVSESLGHCGRIVVHQLFNPQPVLIQYIPVVTVSPAGWGKEEQKRAHFFAPFLSLTLSLSLGLPSNSMQSHTHRTHVPNRAGICGFCGDACWRNVWRL